MKHLKTYNESLRDKMKPKSDEEIFKFFENLSDEAIFLQSINNNYIKGIRYILDKNSQDVFSNKYIRINFRNFLYNCDDKELIKYFLEKIEFLTTDEIYIIEKYKLGLYQNENKDYEKYIIDLFSKLITYSLSNKELIFYKSKNNDTLYFAYYTSSKGLYSKNIIFEKDLLNKFNLNSYCCNILIKSLFSKYFNVEIKSFSLLNL